MKINMEFKDYFSKQAYEYSRYRTGYPDELFAFLSSLVSEHKLAWDCATGNGQAALGLVPYFDKIIATDASEAQLKHARPNDKITYKAAPAENSGIENASADLITVATAIHWLNTDLFYPEAKRILKPGGVLAAWTYSDSQINETIDPVIHSYSKEIIGIYWPDENKIAWGFEELVTLPFEKIECPEFHNEVQWSLKDYLNYLYTWSATHNYIRETGNNPIELIYNDLLKAWGDEDEKRKVSWTIHLKAGRNV